MGRHLIKLPTQHLGSAAAVGGFFVGAAIGTIVIPLVGTLIGGIVGVIIGGLGGTTLGIAIMNYVNGKIDDLEYRYQERQKQYQEVIMCFCNVSLIY